MSNNNLTQSPSLFSLSKVNTGDQSVSTIHTVNFETKGNIHTPELQSYFESRYRFLTECYNFAREAKINENFDFGQNAVTQSKLKEYIQSKGLANMITGSEFEVITTKVSESLKSINGNQYLTNLEKDIKIKYLNGVRGIETKKLKTSELEKIIKTVDITLEELFNLSSKDIQSIFKYELFEICENWKVILNQFRAEYADYNNELNAGILFLINDFLDKSYLEFEEIYSDVKMYLFDQDNIKNPVKSFVNRLFFVFDGKVKKLESDYCLEINEKLNSWLQGLTQYFVQKGNYYNDDEKTKEIRECIHKVQRLDFGGVKTPERFLEMIKIAITPAEIEKIEIESESNTNKKKPKKARSEEQETKLREYNNCFLRHPKSAPSYPDISGKVLKWDSINKTSLVIDQNKSNLDSKKFMDYLLFRAKKVIENDEFYSIYRFVTDSKTNLDWSNFLNRIIEKKEVEININDKYLVILQENKQLEENLINVKGKNKSRKQIQQIRFLTGSGNDKFSPIQYIVKDGNSLQFILNKKLNELTQKYPELYVLQNLMKENYLDEVWINNWITTLELGTKTQDLQKNETNKDLISKKLSVNTENRLGYFTQTPNLNTQKVVDYLLEYLTKLEKHLLLDKSQNLFKIFDKLAFKRYSAISQLVFEAFLGDHKDKNGVNDSFKQIRSKKAELSKLLQDKEAIIPLKISRMTNRTSGNSTLLFDVEIDSNKQIKLTSNAHLICSPVKMESGESVKIVEDLIVAIKELTKKNSKYAKLMVGFLNGGGDNRYVKKVNLVFDKKGLPLYRNKEQTIQKSYQTYTNWQLVRNLNGLDLAHGDVYRGENETVGGTSPAGYPKLYYYLVPKECCNLIIPVETSSYYLKKYNAVHHISNYLELEEKILNSDGQNKVDAFHELLDLRCKLRFYYAISSFEVDLIQELKPINNQIVPRINAIAHLQFSNPIKQQQEFDEEKDKVQEKRKYSESEIKSKFKTILSIDLGEKHLAVANLQKIDWDNPTEIVDKSAQFYLPLQYSSTKNGTKVVRGFDQIYHFDFETKPELDAAGDKTYRVFDSIKKQYKQEQKQFGTVSQNLREKKNHFTDQVIENISTQIAKLAMKHSSFVVFERLQTGLSSKKLEVTTCTEILNQTYKKLTKIGLTLGNDSEYLSNKIDKGVARVNPFMTSQTCSECGYVPIIYKYNDQKTDEENEYLKKNKRVIIDSSKWIENGLIKFSFGGSLFATIKSKDDQIVVWRKNNLEEFEKSIYYKKVNTSFVPIKMIDWIKENLLTGLGKQRTIRDKINSVFKSTVLKPRLSQDKYCCPCCGMRMNADYNASKNIANEFLKKL